MVRVNLDVDSPRGGAGAGSLPGTSPSNAGSWRWRDVQLRRVLAQQDWGGLLTAAFICVGLLIAQALLGGPRSRPFTLYDSTISFPYLPSTIPYWLVIVIAVAALVGSVLAAEVWLGGYADASDAAAAALFFFLDCLCAFFVTGTATEVTKRVVGRLRPNFLSLCQPAGDGSTVPVDWGQPASLSPACTAPASSELTDARYSFPSGHASTAFAFAVWTACYCLWAFTMRRRTPAPALRALPLRQRLTLELRGCGAWLWSLALLGWAWAVGVSRITDFKHHPSDVIGGAFLGTLVASLYITRAVWRLDSVVVLPAAGCAAAAGCGGGAGTPDTESSLLHGDARASNV